MPPERNIAIQLHQECVIGKPASSAGTSMAKRKAVKKLSRKKQNKFS